MSNPVPPPGGGYPPPPAQGQPGYPPPGQPVPGQPAPGGSYAPGGQGAPGGSYGPGSYGPGQPGPGGSSAPGGQFEPGGQPGFPPPPPPGQPGAEGFGQPGAEGFGQFPTEKPKKSGRARLLRIGGGVLAVLVVIGVKFGLSSALNDDKAKEAKVGDCVAAQGKVPTQEGKTTQADAQVVDCTSTKAAYTVVGRVNGETDTNSKACDQFFTDEKADYFVYSSTSGDGYLLCLQSKKA